MIYIGCDIVYDIGGQMPLLITFIALARPILRQLPCACAEELQLVLLWIPAPSFFAMSQLPPQSTCAVKGLPYCHIQMLT